MGIISSVLGAVAGLFGSGDRPQQPPPEERPPPQPFRPYRPQQYERPPPQPPKPYRPQQPPPEDRPPPQPFRPYRPQQPPPEERPPPRPVRPHGPQEERPPQTHPPSTRPPKQRQQHKPRIPRPSKHQRDDSNQHNQDDPHYVSLRARANEEGDNMARCFDESQRAYTSGDKAGAKVLSNEGKEHKAKMEGLNAEASAWVYAKNNEDSGPGEIDLHGLYVKEAIDYTDRAIEAARRRGDTTINVIVGKGLHSSDGVAKLKPAIEALMQKHNLVAELDPDNAGVLIVQLGGRGSGRHSIGADEVTHRLEESDESCVIM